MALMDKNTVGHWGKISNIEEKYEVAHHLDERLLKANTMWHKLTKTLKGTPVR